jgi:hypothetical protein
MWQYELIFNVFAFVLILYMGVDRLIFGVTAIRRREHTYKWIESLTPYKTKLIHREGMASLIRGGASIVVGLIMLALIVMEAERGMRFVHVMPLIFFPALIEALSHQISELVYKQQAKKASFIE